MQNHFSSRLTAQKTEQVIPLVYTYGMSVCIQREADGGDANYVSLQNKLLNGI